jgi:hypothetical protein
MDQNNETNRRWLEYLATGLAAVGALIAIAGPMLVLGSQPGGPGNSNWPLPGLVLMDWAILGVLGFLGAYLGTKPLVGGWARSAWFVVGALIPLMVLGAFSIGPLVLLTLAFLAASAILVTIYKRIKAVDVLGIFLLGVIINLGILLGLIALGGNL